MGAGEKGLVEDLRLDAPGPTVGAIVVDLTTAGATGGARVSIGARRIRPSSVRDWAKNEVYPGSAPCRVKSLLPALCIDLGEDYRVQRALGESRLWI